MPSAQVRPPCTLEATIFDRSEANIDHGFTRHHNLEGFVDGTPTWFIWVTYPFCVTPFQGEFTSLFAATSAEVAANRKKYKGAYLVPYGKISSVTKEARDLVLAKTLWETSEKVVRDALQRGGE